MKNKEFWVFLFFLGTLLFNWPFLDIFNMFLVYYFPVVWGLFILTVYAALRLTGRQDRNG
jgi:hypothetical protein